MPSLPIGLSIVSRTCGLSSCFSFSNSARRTWSYKVFILVMTYLTYMAYHLSRRPLSVVKNVLNRNCSYVIPPAGMVITNATRDTWCEWQPFTGQDANTLLGLLDSSFLFSYAIFMFISGFVAERCHLRYFLALGMILSGLFTYLFGIAFYYNIHSLYYFLIVQVICGALQTTGWPAVVACVGLWFGPRSRGLVFGIWNSHTNVGNILGAIIPGFFVEYNWGLSFIVPGIIIAAIGFLVFLFLVPYPEEVGIVIDESRKRDDRAIQSNVGECDDNDNDSNISNVCTDSMSNQHRRKMRRLDETAENDSLFEEERPLLVETNVEIEVANKKAISFMKALTIPGVIEFSLCLFFAKLVSYTFLYWLPKYIGEETGNGKTSAQDSAFLSTPFDIGGMLGAIVAGYLTDRTGCSANICIVMLGLAIPSLYLYQIYGSINNITNITLQIVAGLFVNGPYALITTSVSAELGDKVESTRALATVSAIIDGTGSIGAAVGPFLAGLVSESGWQNVFYMVMIADLLALLSLLRIGRQEWRRRLYRQNL